jgi:hypothetical protein
MTDVDVSTLLADRALAEIGPDVRRMWKDLSDRLKEGRRAGALVLVLDDFAASPSAADPAFRAAVAQAKPLADLLARLGFRVQVTGSQALVDYATSAGMSAADAGMTRAALVASRETLERTPLKAGWSSLPIVKPSASDAEFDLLNVAGIFYQAAELSMMRPGDAASDGLVRYTAEKHGALASEWGAIRATYRKLADGDAAAPTLEEAVRLVALPKLAGARVMDLVNLMQKVARSILSAA